MEWDCGRGNRDYYEQIMLVLACRKFAQRMSELKTLRGEKTSLIEAAIDAQTRPFRIREIQSACPGISIDMIRVVLKK